MKNGTQITETHLPKQLDIGIDIRSTVPGVVPTYECMEACKFGGYTWSQWLDTLDYDTRVEVLAHYRMHNLIESHIHAVAASASRRNNGAANRSRANRR